MPRKECIGSDRLDIDLMDTAIPVSGLNHNGLIMEIVSVNHTYNIKNY